MAQKIIDVNGLLTNVGDLTKLTTTAKDTLVNAVNEVKSSGGSGGGSGGGGTTPITVTEVVTSGFSIVSSLSTQVGNFIMLSLRGNKQGGIASSDTLCELSGFTIANTQISFHPMLDTNTGVLAGIARFNGSGSVHQLEVFSLVSGTHSSISVSTVIPLY